MDSAERTLPFETYLSLASFAVPDFCPESAWADHAPFAFWLTETLRPRTFVELGTHGGYSYFAFCQAVKAGALSTRCFAVDTWKGDEHAGFYSEEFYNKVFDHNRTHYAEFSRLVRATFDEAVEHFSDGSVDLLHIDGRHFYSDVKHDFETWRPKLSDRAVVLFHDTNVRERNFGVFRLWEELRDIYRSFEFFHGHGLGVLGFGPNMPPAIEVLFDACRDPGTAERVRRVYARLGQTFHTQTVASARIAALTKHAEALQRRGDTLDGVVADLNRRLGDTANECEHVIAERELFRAEQEHQRLRADDMERHASDIQRHAETLERRGIELESEIQALAEKHAGQLENLREIMRHEIAERDNAIVVMRTSTSWKLTAPWRALGRALHTAQARLRIMLGRTARHLYRVTPLPLSMRRAIVGVAFTLGKPLFKHARVYQDWAHAKGAKKGIAGILDLEFGPAREVAAPIEIDYSAAVPFSYPVAPPPVRLAAVCHIFHEHITPEIQRYLRNIPFGFDVFVTTDKDEKKEIIEAFFTGWDRGQVEVRVTPNRGRDIAPKLVGVADIYDRYDYVLHLHSKVSKHATTLEAWRTFLYTNMLGSTEIVNAVFEIFARRADVGMVASQHFEPVRHGINWGYNFQDAEKLAARFSLALDPAHLLDFPSGSMFWARTAALKPLLDLKLSVEDFDPESGQLDATLAHAIERLYFHSCEAAGLRAVKIAHPPLFAATPGIASIAAPADLDRFVEEKTYKLTDPNAPAPRTEQEQPLPAAPSLIAVLQDSALGLEQAIDPKMHVAIGIVAEGGGAHLDRTIRSAEAALARAGIAGCVYTTGSHGRELGRKNVIAVPTPSATGFGASQNQLMRKAFDDGADVFITASADGAFHPDSIVALLQMMQANGGRALVEALQFPVEQARFYNPLTFETGWCSDVCLAIPRTLYAATAGFDEILPACEDVDLSWRARAHGFVLRTCPRALFLYKARDRKDAPLDRRPLLNAGIILARKWGNAALEAKAKDELEHMGASATETPAEPVPLSWRRFADFTHQFTFAEPRG